MIRSHVMICGGSGCTASGSKALQEAMEKELVAKDLQDEVKVVQTGCFGLCELGPIMVVYPGDVFYSRVTVDDIPEIVEEHLLKGRIVERLVHEDEVLKEQVTSLNDTSFYQVQKRVALKNCGLIDPESIDEYLAMDGYVALQKVLQEMTASSGNSPRAMTHRRSSSAVTPTKATPVLSWTVPSWKATPTWSSKP